MSTDFCLYLFRFLQIAIISFLNAGRLGWPLWTWSKSEQTKVLKYSWMATWCSSGILNMLMLHTIQFRYKVKKWIYVWAVEVWCWYCKCERTLRGPYAASSSSRCPVRTCWTVPKILARCLSLRWWSWVEAVVEDCRILQDKDRVQTLQPGYISPTVVFICLDPPGSSSISSSLWTEYCRCVTRPMLGL